MVGTGDGVDVAYEIDAVRRRVGKGVFKEVETRVVALSRTFGSPPAEVWDACTRSERIPRWFLPISGDLRGGGRYQLQGNAGGTIERCDPPNGFFATWEFGGR
ncbi:SRPBCC domain-containing protein [Streptomyces sp. NPDC048664]|uniref:SRPBCC domain-containing protein n=1 Tax=Streptomyces sp. NPDC048664 TaxID=3154505 RepID=UPI003428F226